MIAGNGGSDTLTQSNKWITVVTVSKWYEDMFINWWYWYNLLDLKMDVILVAEDSYIFQK